MAKYGYSRKSSLAAGARVLRQAIRRFQKSRQGPAAKRAVRPRTAMRKAARTATKRRRRHAKSAQTDIATTLQSGFVYAYGRRRLLRKGQGKASYLVNGATRIDSTTTGIQTYTDLGPVYKYTHLNSMFNNIPAVTNNSLLMLRGATAKYFITNCHQTPVKIILYDCIVKRDNDDDVPSTAFNQGLSDMSGGTLGANTVAITPYKSTYFNTFHKIKKVTQVYLDPGAVHTHYVKAKVNKVYSKELLTRSPANYYKAISSFVLLVAHGLPVNDSTVSTTVSTARVTLDVITTIIYDYTWDAHSDNNASQSNVLSTGVVEKAIEVMDGAIALTTSA